DRLADLVRRRVNAHERVPAARHPDRAGPDGYADGALDVRRNGRDLPRLRVDDADGIVLDSRKRLAAARAAGQGEDGYRRSGSEPARGRADDTRPRVVRTLHTGGADLRERRREALRDQLVHVLGPVEVLEAVDAEVADAHPGDLFVTQDRRCRLRQQHLPTVAGGHDPRGAVDPDAVVSLFRDDGLAGVQTDADPHGAVIRPLVLGECALRICCGQRRVARPPEYVEERVALGVDLVAVVSLEGLADDLPVPRPHLGPAVLEVPDESGRTFDVGEYKGDRAAPVHATVSAPR